MSTALENDSGEVNGAGIEKIGSEQQDPIPIDIHQPRETD